MRAAAPVTDWRGLTVRQWWCWGIAYGGKPVENRGPGALAWRYQVGRRVAFHAAKEPDVQLRGRLTLSCLPGDPAPRPRLEPTWAGPTRNPRYDSERALARAIEKAPLEHLPALDVRSAVLATAVLVDVHRATGRCCGPWAEAAYSWGPHVAPATHLLYEDVRPVWPPIDCSGRLGLWVPTPEVVAALEEAVAA